MKDQCIGINIKQKSGNKNTTNEHKYFIESNLVEINRLFVLVYSNVDDNAKRCKSREYFSPKGVIKHYNVVINRKNFYDQPIDSDIKRCKEIRKLTTGQGEDYTRGYFLDHDYIKKYYRLIAVDLSRQKE